MEDYIRVTGKTVEDALLEASIELGTSSDNIEYRVVERETKGFLGLGAKKAVIEARKKNADNTDEDIIGEIFSEQSSKPVKKEKTKVRAAQETQEKQPEKEISKKKPVPASDQKQTQKPVTTGKSAPAEKPVSGVSEKVSEKKDFSKKESSKSFEKPTPSAKKEPVKKQSVQETQNPEAVKNNQDSRNISGAQATEEPEKERPARVPADPAVVQKRARTFLSDMFQAMGMEVKIDMTYENGILSIELSGDDMGTLIGKRGQTLDSIQYLTGLVVNKGKASYVRVKIDTENYRERRAATLENLARNIAFKVKKTRRPVYLEPMNPYERRIIHSALQNDPYVTTHSEGEEPNRKVVVTLKRRERPEQEEDE